MNIRLPPDFISSEYGEIHPDLQSFPSKQLKQHYLQFGCKQKRPYRWSQVLPHDFIPENYRSLHLDLSSFTPVQLKRHYHSFGRKERRPYRSELLPSDFCPKEYQWLNPDLQSLNSEQLGIHYLQYGKKERRTYSSFQFPHSPTTLLHPDFEPEEYGQIHKDLESFHDEQLTQHYIQFGRTEKRPYRWSQALPCHFIAEEYGEIHPDLHSLSTLELKQHYFQWGRKEKRPYRWSQVLPHDFIPENYRSLHVDLRSFTPVQLKRHYHSFGRKEQRPYRSELPSDFQPEEYQWLNPDLQSLNSEQLETHYLRFGKKEKREYCFKTLLPNDFDASEYAEIHDDLGALSSTFHYVRVGQKEHRVYRWSQILPPDFNVEQYRQFHPELSFLSVVQLKQHYYKHGKNENHIYRLYPKEFFEPTLSRQPEIVSDIKSSSLYQHLCQFMYQESRVLIPLVFQSFTWKDRVFDLHDLDYSLVLSYSKTLDILSSIPRTLHLIHLEDTFSSMIVEKKKQLWSHFYVDWDIRYYGKSEIESFIEHHYGKSILFMYRHYFPILSQYEFIRNCLLYEKGGMVSHLMDQCHRKIDTKTFHSISINKTYFIASVAKHPFLKFNLDILMQMNYFNIQMQDKPRAHLHDQLLEMMKTVKFPFPLKSKSLIFRQRMVQEKSHVVLTLYPLTEHQKNTKTQPLLSYVKTMNSRYFDFYVWYLERYILPLEKVIPIPSRSRYQPFISFSNQRICEDCPLILHHIVSDKNRREMSVAEWKVLHSWKQKYPSYWIKLHDSERIPLYLQKHFGDPFLYLYESLLDDSFRKEFFAACLLYKEGGMVLDVNYECLQRLEFYQVEFLCLEEQDTGRLQTDCLLCPPQHPYIKAYMDLVIQNTLERDYGLHETDITGGMVLKEAIQQVQRHWSHRNPERELLFMVCTDSSSIKKIRYQDYPITYFQFQTPSISMENSSTSTYRHGWLSRELFLQDLFPETLPVLEELNFRILGDFVAVWLERHEWFSIQNMAFYKIILRGKGHRTFLVLRPTDLSNSRYELYINNEYKIAQEFTVGELQSLFQTYVPSYDLTMQSMDHWLSMPLYEPLHIPDHYSSPFDFYPIYFPQFHSIAENNVNFYQGYTDITNLSQFLQDSSDSCRQSIEQQMVSYPCLKTFGLNSVLDYDLTNPSILQRQIDLCVDLDIQGFAMYWYWFSRNEITQQSIIMKSVIDLFFSGTIQLKRRTFFFLWANENWSNNVALSHTSLRIENIYDTMSFERHMHDLIPYVSHANYLKIQNKPVFSVHHPFFMSEEELFLFYQMLSSTCRSLGFEGVHLLINEIAKPYDESFYTGYYINPNYKIHLNCKQYHPHYSSRTIDYSKYIEMPIHFPEHRIQTLLFDFDNRVRLHTPSKLHLSTIMIHNSEYQKKKLLTQLFDHYQSRSRKYPLSNLCLINAWNEWGEKMVMEPNVHFGFYLINLFIRHLHFLKTKKKRGVRYR